MIDLYLLEQMHGNITNKKNRFIHQLNKEIDEAPLEVAAHSEFETDNVKILRLKCAMKKELEFPEISSRIPAALNLLYDDNELDSLEKENILSDFVQAREIIDQLSENTDLTSNLKTSFKISDRSIESIFKLAIKKLEAAELENSLALFILLVVLVPENSDYCYRAGLIAQMCAHIEFAEQLYTACIMSNPEMIEAKVLLLDCYIKLGDMERGVAVYRELVDLPSPLISDSINSLFLTLKSQLFM